MEAFLPRKRVPLRPAPNNPNFLHDDNGQIRQSGALEAGAAEAKRPRLTMNENINAVREADYEKEKAEYDAAMPR